jgi:hypothetical protein
MNSSRAYLSIIYHQSISQIRIFLLQKSGSSSTSKHTVFDEFRYLKLLQKNSTNTENSQKFENLNFQIRDHTEDFLRGTTFHKPQGTT